MAELNKISNFTRKLCSLLSYCGLPNLWANGISTTSYYNHFQKLITIIVWLFLISEWMSFRTQENLSEKQASDRLLFCFSHPILWSYYCNAVFYKNEMVNLIHRLCITLKKDYNDTHIEQATIKRIIFYAGACFSTIGFSLVSYGFDGIMQAVRSEGTFTTVITVWPDVTDTSVKASITRVINYIIWWAFAIRISAGFVVAIYITISISHLYKNLQSYFYSLNDIFKDCENVKPQEQENREKIYEEAIKLGFKLHDETLWCTNQCQLTCSTVFSGQILINVAVICLLMLQMVSSERTLMNALAIVSTSAAVLVSTGFLMWNAGDITVEAALIPTAMFYSGWHNCRGTSAPRIKKMLVIAMRQSQVLVKTRPVVIHGFGIIELSYQSYVSIVKSSYSAFSLLY